MYYDSIRHVPSPYQKIFMSQKWRKSCPVRSAADRCIWQRYGFLGFIFICVLSQRLEIKNHLQFIFIWQTAIFGYVFTEFVLKFNSVCSKVTTFTVEKYMVYKLYNIARESSTDVHLKLLERLSRVYYMKSGKHVSDIGWPYLGEVGLWLLCKLLAGVNDLTFILICKCAAIVVECLYINIL